MELQELKTLGLTQGEIKVYSAVLHIGSSSINNIHERIGMERRAIYDIINKLIEKGLLTYTVEKGRRTYQCSSPNKLKDEVNKRIESLKEFEKRIPEIEEIYKSSKPKINAEIFRGSEGIKAVWEDMLNFKEIRWIGSGRYVPKKFPLWFTHWNKRRIHQKVMWINLMRAEMRAEIKKPMQYERMKFLPKEFSGNPIVISIYGDKVANFTFREEWFAFIIQSRDISENYKKYHKFLWDNVAKD